MGTMKGFKYEFYSRKEKNSEINVIGWVLENIPTSTIKHTTLYD